MPLPPTEDERVPFWKNLWVWAGIVGIVSITLTRPCLRRVPEPPPPGPAIAAFAFHDTGGAPITLDDLRGQVWVASVTAKDCTSCARAQGAMRRLQDLFERDRIDVRLVTFVAESAGTDVNRVRDDERRFGATAPRWRFAVDASGAVNAWAPGVVSLVADPARVFRGPSDAWFGANALILVDRDGRTRGVYGTDDLGVDEVYYRAQHVLKETAPGAR